MVLDVLTDPDQIWSIIEVSLYVSVIAVALSTILSLAIAFTVGLTSFRGKRLVTAIINTGMGLPSVVVGLAVLLLLSNEGPLGGLQLTFTPEAMIISQMVLATPVITGVALSAIEGVDRGVHEAAYVLGGTRLDVYLVYVREARLGIVTGVLAGFGRAISEVGSVLIVGGNISWADGSSYTRTLTTAIQHEARLGNFELALQLGVVLLAFVLIVNVLLLRLRDQGGHR